MRSLLASQQIQIWCLCIAFLATYFSEVKAQNMVLPSTFFEIELNYDLNQTSELTAKQVNQAKSVNKLNTFEAYFARLSQEAMRLLLVRLTGRPQLPESRLGQQYIQQANNWLRTYQIKPRMVDGVEVGKKIEFYFNAKRLKRSFEKNNISIWAAYLRPKTLVMGSFLQNGRLLKLDQETLGYRVDVAFKRYPEQLKLGIKVPKESKNWMFPVPEGINLSQLQENLLVHNLKHLLSFKLEAQKDNTYDLEWVLYSIEGKKRASAKTVGKEPKPLLEDMFAEVVQSYVKRSAVQTLARNTVFLEVRDITSAQQLLAIQTALLAQEPLLESVQLEVLEKTKTDTTARFKIDYQGDFQALANWTKRFWAVSFERSEKHKAQIVVQAKEGAEPPAEELLPAAREF